MKQDRKRLHAGLTACLMLLSLMALFAAPAAALVPSYQPSAAYRQSVYYSRLCAVSLGRDMRQNLVNVALSQVGYHEGNSTADLGGGNSGGSADYTEYGYYYGTQVLGSQNGYFLPWCAMFVTFCARQAGIPTSIINSSPVAYGSASAQNGFRVPTYRYTSTANIRPGDLVYLEYNNDGYGFDHVAIVYKVDSSYIYTVDGNYSRGVQNTARYHRSNGQFEWDSHTWIANYSVPAYQEASDGTVLDNFDPYGGFPEPTRDLYYKSPVFTGTDVSWVQYTLYMLGYRIDVDGSYGTMTRDQVMLFQKNSGLAQSGRVDAATRQKIRYMVDTYVIIDADPPPGYFEDVPFNSWFYEAIGTAYINGLFSGTGNYSFSPLAPMTRAMFVSVLWRLDGKPSATAGNPFSDISSGQWYTTAVLWASSTGIVSGTDSTHFSPNASISREQIASLLYRYAAYKHYDTSGRKPLTFADSATVSDWALEPVSWAVAAGLLQGRDGNLLAPLNSATRAEVASVFNRFQDTFVGEHPFS